MSLGTGFGRTLPVESLTGAASGHNAGPSTTRAGWGLRGVRWAVTLGVLMAATASARTASAYCRTTTTPKAPYDDMGCPTGLPIFWPTSCVTFSMQYLASKQVDLATATDVMDKAFAVWQTASCAEEGSPPAIKLDRHFGTVACTLHEYNQTDSNANIIVFRDDVWPYSEGGANILALTTVTYSTKTGAIFDVDMEVNSTQHLSVEDPVPQNAYDLQSILTHEAGHFLGLAHTPVTTATMYATYSSGSAAFRMLDPDDVDGICAVYPAATAARCDATPRQGFSPACGIFPSGDGGKCSLAQGGLARTGSSGKGWIGLAVVLAGIGGWCGRRRRGQAEGR
jgi:hypothetical protein